MNFPPLSFVYENLKNLFFILISVIALIWPAIYNGYPLVYSDSGAYIFTGFINEVPVDRPIFYSLFVRHMSMAFSLWFVIVVQAILVLFVIYMVVRQLLTNRILVYTSLIIVTLSVTTGISNYTSQIMPDIFSALTILGFGVLVLVDQWRLKEWLLAVIVMYAGLTHLSNVIVLLGMTLVLFVLFILKKTNKRTFFRSVFVAFFPLLILLSVNKIYTGDFKISRASNIFLAGRLIEIGVLKPYLKENCENENFQLCSQLDDIPPHAWVFLWDAESPLYSGGCNDRGMEFCWESKNQEYGEIVKGILAQPKYLKIILKTCSTDFVKQLFDFKIGGLVPQKEHSSVQRWMEEYFKNELSSYKHAIQYSKTLEFELMSSIQFFIVALTFFFVSLVLVIHRGVLLVKTQLALIYLFLIGILGNALTVVTFSAVLDRYQSRIIWIIPLIGFVLLVKLFFHRKNAMS